MWRLRIEQYFQVQDYALWDVIENENSFKPAAKTTTNADGISTILVPGPVTTKGKVQKKNDMKARSMLLMTLPNEHLMTFNQYKDAKTLLQKIVSQLAILGENISQEDLNLNLKNQTLEWNTHVVVWRNKPDLDTMSFDDLYNNFKIVEQAVKGTQRTQSSTRKMEFEMAVSIAEHEDKKKLLPKPCWLLMEPGLLTEQNAYDEVPTNMALILFQTLSLSLKNVSEDTSNEVRESPDAPMVEKLVSDDKLEKKTIFPTVAKIEFVRAKQQEKPVRKPGHPQQEDQGYVDSGCSRHMIGKMSYLSNFKEFDRGYVTFGEEQKEEKLLVKELLKLFKPHNKALKNYFDVEHLLLSSHDDHLGCHVTIYTTLDYIRYKPLMIYSNAGKKGYEGVSKESGIDDQERPKNSSQDVNTIGPSINTVSSNTNTDHVPLEATHVDFFGDETEVDMSKITTTYPVPSTLNTRIHKDHSLDHVIGDVQSGVQTRKMTKTTNEQWFISAIYEGKTHEDLHTCLFAYFLS
ncbi:hypothetical protein Tco_0900175 [Tanacetum coccineum]